MDDYKFDIIRKQMKAPISQEALEASMERLRQQLRIFFEHQLDELELTQEKIDLQTLEELETSLETVNDAIGRAVSFGVFRIEIGSDGHLSVTKAHGDAHFEIGITPFLLESKRLILERLSEIRKKEQIENLSQLIYRVTDETTRERLTLELTRLSEQASIWRKNFEELEKQQSQTIENIQKQSTEQIAQLTKSVKLAQKSEIAYRILSGLALAILGSGIVMILPQSLNWEWLLTHPKKFAIQTSLCMINFGLSWAIVDGNSNRRWFAIGSIVVAASLGIIGLL